MNCLNFKIWPELEPIKSLSRGWFLIFNFQLVSKQPVYMTSKSSDICYKWWSNTKFLVFAMLFLKDNIITMLTPENDSLLAYNASCWASTRSSRTDLSMFTNWLSPQRPSIYNPITCATLCDPPNYVGHDNIIHTHIHKQLLTNKI